MNNQVNQVIVGIDWSDKTHVACIYQVDAGHFDIEEVSQKPELFHAWIDKLIDTYNQYEILVCLEQGKGPVLSALMVHSEHIACYPINPKSLARYREALYPSRSKSDPVDAQLIAEYLSKHQDRYEPVSVPDSESRKLSSLCENRRRIVDKRSGILNMIKAELKKYFPQIVDWFPDLSSNTTLDFIIKWPTLDAAQSARKNTVLDFLYAHNVRRGKLLKELPDTIKNAMALHNDEAIIFTSSIYVESLCKVIISMNKQIKRLDDLIATLVKTNKDMPIFLSFPFAGKQMAPRIAVAFSCCPKDVDSAVVVAQLAGIAPVTEQSGQTSWTHKRWAASSFMRQTFHEYAKLSTRSSVWAKKYFDLQVKKNKQKSVIYRSLAYKWIRIMYRCWVNGEEYCEEKYIEQLATRNSPYC